MPSQMKELTIGEVARQAGFPPSTLRYYESVGLIRPSGRVSKQRRYHPEVLNRLAVIEAAQQVGFSVAVIGRLLEGFESDQLKPDGPWESLAQQKLTELDQLLTRVRQMQKMLNQLLACECVDLNECGQNLIERKQAERTDREDAPGGLGNNSPVINE